MRRGSTSRSQAADRQGQALQRHERLAQAVDARPGGGVTIDVLPGGEKAGQRALIDRLDLLAQRSQRRPAQAAQDLGVTPLALAAARAQLAADEVAGAFELGQRGGEVDPIARPQIGHGERPVGGAVAAGHARERIGHVLQEDGRQAARGHRAERVAVQARVGGVDPALLAARGEPEPPDARPASSSSIALGVQPGQHARGDLGGAQIPERAQDVVEGVAARGLALGREELQVALDSVQGARVDEVAQLLLAEQLAQQVAVQRQRRGPALGRRRVALVHVGGDVVEQQRGGKRRRGGRLDLDQRQLAAVQSGEQLHQAGEVEDVAQTLAIGLENDRELAVLARHLEQGLGLQALLPQRGALARPRAGDEQRAGGVLAEARAEQRRGRRARPRSAPAPPRDRAARARPRAAHRHRAGGR